MAVTFDIILTAIFLFFVVRYLIFGLVGALLRAGRFIFSILAAALLCRPCASLLSGLFKNFPAGSGLLSGTLGFVFAFIVVFIISTIVIKLIGSIKIPIVSTLNRLLGLALGLAVGILVVSALSTVLFTVLEVIMLVNPQSDAMNVYYSSNVFRFVYDLKVFEFIRNII